MSYIPQSTLGCKQSWGGGDWLEIFQNVTDISEDHDKKDIPPSEKQS